MQNAIKYKAAHDGPTSRMSGNYLIEYFNLRLLKINIINDN